MTHYNSLYCPDYPEEPQQCWEPSHCCCQHNQQSCSPQEETRPERTQTDGADTEDAPDDVRSGAETVEAEDLNKDATEDSEGAERELDLNDHRDTGGKVSLGVPEEDLVGVLEELEISLKATSVLEQEKMEDLSRTAETETSCSVVRRRNRKKRAKKASY